MPIDFADPQVRETYAGRSADAGWGATMCDLVGDPGGRTVIDLGCGGGIYSRAWLELGAAHIIGVDNSAQFLAVARRAMTDRRFEATLADATSTELPSGVADIVFARALVHHVSDPHALVAEGARLARPGGWLIVQDRTMADIEQPAGPNHPRGYFYVVHPRLRDIEAARRPSTGCITDAVRLAGLHDAPVRHLWEVRRRYDRAADLLADLAARTGRSILHELTDAELELLVGRIGAALGPGPVTERDRWSVWAARKPLTA